MSQPLTKEQLEKLQDICDEAAIALMLAVNDFHEATSTTTDTSYAELFGLAVLVLEGVNYQAVMNEKRKALTKRARIGV